MNHTSNNSLNYFFCSNFVRALGYDHSRAWFYSNRQEQNSKISYFAAFFFKSEWVAWGMAVKATFRGDYAEPFTPDEEQHQRSASVMQSESVRQRELLLNRQKPQFTFSCNKIEESKLTNLKSINCIVEKWLGISRELSQSSEASDQIIRDATSVISLVFQFINDQVNPSPLSSNSNQTYEIITCHDGENICGIAIFEPKLFQNNIHLEYLIIDPRNLISTKEKFEKKPKIRGAGKALINKIFERCLEEKKGLELTSTSSAIPFYQKLGFIEEEDALLSEMVLEANSIKLLCGNNKSS